MLCDLIKSNLLNIERWISRYAFMWLYVYYVEYNITLSGRLIDRLPICMNG